MAILLYHSLVFKAALACVRAPINGLMKNLGNVYIWQGTHGYFALSQLVFKAVWACVFENQWMA